MSGITTGVGLFSGIDSASLIDQLINAQSRPIVLAQSRVIQLRQQQAAYLDINSRLDAFKSAAASFRVNDIFSSRNVSSSNDSILSVSANNSAVAGSYNFIVDRLVTTQQMLSRGFADQDTTAAGIDSITIESDDARLDSDTPLADLNNGDGITRGIIKVNGVDVDLSRVGTTQEVLNAISEVTGVSARVENDHFVISGVTSLEQESGAGILESLGLEEYAPGAETEITGSSVYGIQSNTSLQALNDGRGVAIRQISGQDVQDFEILIVDSTDTDGDGDVTEQIAVKVRIGDIEGPLTDDEGDPILDDEDNPVIGVVDGAVSTVGGVIDRINSALSDAGFGEFTAAINTSSGGIDINDSLGRSFDIQNFSNNSGVVTTASDLGLVGSYTGSASGSRLLAGLNTKLVSSLNGGTGLGTTDGLLNFQTQDTTAPDSGSFQIDVSGLNDVNDIINAINNDSNNNGRVVASINSQGTGIQIVDTTTGAGTFGITGTGGADTAAVLGLDGTYSDGVAGGSNLQLAYIGNGTLLSDLNNGEGIGTGTFEIVDSNGTRAEIRISSSDKTVADLLRAINTASPALAIEARINDNGDGIAIYEDNGTDPNGAQEISITDISGAVASRLRIEGEASGTDGDNFIDGSYETIINFDADATLEDVRNEINSSNAGVSVSILNTGSGTSPYRLNFTSERSGVDGRFLIDTGDFDLGLSQLNEGNDARVFFGSSDPAQGVLLTSSVNQLDGVIQGVTIDLASASDESVEVSVTTNTTAIEEKVSEFVTAFNSVIEGIDFRTRFDQETEERGVLLGDSTLLNLRNGLYSQLRSTNDGFTSTFNSLTEVGIRVGNGGTLEFDATKFREAYSDDPEAVEALFTQRTQDVVDDDDVNTVDEIVFSELSVLGQLEEFADSYVTSVGGVLKTRDDALDSQIALQEDRIEAIQASLDSRREVLQRQFLAMEQAIGEFQSQGSSLAQLAALG